MESDIESDAADLIQKGGNMKSKSKPSFISNVGSGSVECRELPAKASGFASKFYVPL